MAVRTTVLGHVAVNANSQVLVYTAPTGETALLKDVRVSNPGSGGSGRGLIYVIRATVAVLVGDLTCAAGTTAGFQPWICLQPGDKIEVAALGEALRFHLSGAELAGVNP